MRNPLFYSSSAGGCVVVAMLNYMREVKGEDVENVVRDEWAMVLVFISLVSWTLLNTGARVSS